MYIITKKDRTIKVFNSQGDADFFHKTRHQKHLYKIENSLEEITEEMYYNLLESMPPIYQNGFIFANSEPLDHIETQGRFIPTFNGGTQKGGKYYTFICTLESIKNLMPCDFEV
jgi:hypothetical protein